MRDQRPGSVARLAQIQQINSKTDMQGVAMQLKVRTPRSANSIASLVNAPVVQLLKRYDHGNRLYVNDQDDTPAPQGYQQINPAAYVAGPNWTDEATPSHYFVGSGDLQSQVSFLLNEFDQGRVPTMTVTTYVSDAEADRLYPNTYRKNRRILEALGVTVKNNVDATNPRSMSPTLYDNTHFEFPHTGVYGSKTLPGQDQRAVASNQQLMEESMSALRCKLRQGSMLHIVEGGFPYRVGRIPGINLDALARDRYYSIEPSRELGLRTIKRTVGDSVCLPRTTEHNYRYISAEALRLVDGLLGPLLNRRTKRAIVRTYPTLIGYIARFDVDLARLLLQYYNMPDAEVEPLPTTPDYNKHNDRDDRNPPGMGGANLSSHLARIDNPVYG